MDPGITPDEIQSREQIGWLGQCPVYHVETIGGFNMVLVLRDGKLEPIGVGGHSGIAKGIARKREPGLMLTQLQKSDDDVDYNSHVFRRCEAMTGEIRRSRGYKG